MPQAIHGGAKKKIKSAGMGKIPTFTAADVVVVRAMEAK